MQLIDFSEKSPRKKTGMCRVEVESVVNQCVPNGYIVPPGKSVIQIYKDQLPELKALVRDPEDVQRLAAAKEEYARRFQKYVESDECGGDEKRAKEMFNESVESVYIQQNQGFGYPGVKPLLSVTVIEDNLPPPQAEEMWNAQKLSGDMIANIMASLLGPNSPIVENIVNAVIERIDNQTSSTGGKTQKR